MFESLSDKLTGIVSSIRGKAIISDSDLDTTLREIRVAFLESDVSLEVVKKFIDSIKEKALGQNVLKNIKPDQMIIKIVLIVGFSNRVDAINLFDSLKFDFQNLLIWFYIH